MIKNIVTFSDTIFGPTIGPEYGNLFFTVILSYFDCFVHTK